MSKLSSVSTNVLEKMLLSANVDNLSLEQQNRVSEIIDELISRRFEKKEDIRIYNLINSLSNYYMELKVNSYYKVLEKEFADLNKTDIQDINHIVFAVNNLLEFYTTRKTPVKFNNWNKIIEALNNLTKKSTDAYNAQAINTLIEKINMYFDTKTNSLDIDLNNNFNKDDSEENDVVVSTPKEKIITKRVKIAKSKLTRTDMEKLLASLDEKENGIPVFTEEEQAEYISYALKKWSHDILWNTGSVALAKYLMKNVVNIGKNAYGRQYIDILNIIYDKPHILFELFDTDDTKKVFDKIRNLYMSFEGATENSCKVYLYFLFKNQSEYFKKKKNGEEVFDIIESYYFETIDDVIEKLQKYKGCHFIDLCKEIDVKYIESSFLNKIINKNLHYRNYGDRKAYILKSSETMQRVSVMELIDILQSSLKANNIIDNIWGKINCVQINPHGFSEKEKSRNKKYSDFLNDFLHSFVFSEEDIKTMLDDYEINSYSTRKKLYSSLLLAALTNIETIEEEKAFADIIFSNKKYAQFFSHIFLGYHCNSGSYHDEFDIFWRLFHATYKNIDLTNKETAEAYFSFCFHEYSYEARRTIHSANDIFKKENQYVYVDGLAYLINTFKNVIYENVKLCFPELSEIISKYCFKSYDYQIVKELVLEQFEDSSQN